jgi:hypothetical protein
MEVTGQLLNRIGKVYSLEQAYTHTPKVFLTPYHVGHCCIVITAEQQRDPTMSLGHCCKT